jgi:hypothetical protein
MSRIALTSAEQRADRMESQLETMKSQIVPCYIDGGVLDGSQLLARLENYDRLLRENVDLRLRLRFQQQQHQ